MWPSRAARRLGAAFCVEAVDTVGAGDCFNGAFAVALLEGKRPVGGGAFCFGGSGHLRHPPGRAGLHAIRARTDDFLSQHMFD
jgi:ribokinase